MKKFLIKLLLLMLCVAVAFTAPDYIIEHQGDLSGISLPADFEKELDKVSYSIPNKAVRIMSSNLLVHYESWEGLPVKPRAKMFLSLIDSLNPDVIGVQEFCDGWYCCMQNNMPDDYELLYPVSTGVFVRMTAVIYNTKTLNLISSGHMKYTKGDNPQLRCVVWGVFEQKETKKRFAVANTHFDLIRENQEKAEFEFMKRQTEELVDLVCKIEDEYKCPVFAIGDFNAKDNVEGLTELDAPKIYKKLTKTFTDTKYIAKNIDCGEKQNVKHPNYDHIFIKGDAKIKNFILFSEECISKMSDHYPIFADAVLK